MENEFLVFQKFNDAAVANQIAFVLRQNNIELLLEDNLQILETAYANNNLTVDISLRLRSKDFTNAQLILEEYYGQAAANVDKDYYLFDFTNEELMDIVAHPYEWGYLDNALAKNILKEKGIDIKPETVEILKSKNLRTLARPKNANLFIIYLGYFSAILGGIFGIIIGFAISYTSKTLPDGKKVYTYTQQDRNHGTRMILISVISIIFWVAVRWYLLGD